MLKKSKKEKIIFDILNLVNKIEKYKTAVYVHPKINHDGKSEVDNNKSSFDFLELNIHYSDVIDIFIEMLNGGFLEKPEHSKDKYPSGCIEVSKPFKGHFIIHANTITDKGYQFMYYYEKKISQKVKRVFNYIKNLHIKATTLTLYTVLLVIIGILSRIFWIQDFFGLFSK